jgi:hypothetical protein
MSNEFDTSKCLKSSAESIRFPSKRDGNALRTSFTKCNTQAVSILEELLFELEPCTIEPIDVVLS